MTRGTMIDLRELVYEELNRNSSADPGDITDAVLDRIPDDDLREVLRRLRRGDPMKGREPRITNPRLARSTSPRPRLLEIEPTRLLDLSRFMPKGSELEPHSGSGDAT
jgi:hypothetical protein